MSQTVLSTSTSADGLWVTTVYSDGSTSFAPALGSAQANQQTIQQTIQQALQQAVTYFGGNYTNWSTLTAAQKDTAAKNGQRALAQIARWLLGQFDSAD